MALIVQKYGGTSVATPDHIKRVAQRIVSEKRDGHRVVVVVSAIGHTTDELIAMAHEVSQHPPEREMDMLLSVGERISIALLAMAIHDLGENAISFTGSQVGIITDNKHTEARILEVRANRLLQELDKGKIVIVAGFQGVSIDKEITTLGRGGSDTTAIALAAALKADRCEIMKDVDGIFVTEPKLIPEAKLNKEISYEEENNKINCDFDIEYENSINQKLCEKPVYLEETGEKLGIVLDKIFDEKNNISRYKIQDCNSKSILNLEADQFDENKYGLIFRPKWYKDSLKTLEKIEFKDKISPELSTLLTDDENYNKKLFEIFIKHDKEMTNYMKDANLLNDTLNERLKIFENKRISLKDELLDLTEMRLIRDIDKKEFYDSVINYRRRLNILHLNIKKCKKLLSRLEKTSFGILNNNLVTFDNKLASNNVKKKSVKNKNVKKSKKNEDNVFKERYYRLKNEYDDLHNEYKDLRLAVEKLLILNKK